MKPGLIIALDVTDSRQAMRLVQRLGKSADFYKIPPSLAVTSPQLIARLKSLGKRLFLDGKWFDIPSQMARSVQTAGVLGFHSCTVHASAGGAALEACARVRRRPQLWAVTVLTSFSALGLRQVGIERSPQDQARRLAKLAESSGVDGVVCSPQEVSLFRRAGIKTQLITPGIRWGEHPLGDQSRTATPQEAWEAGANFIVVGRPVTEAQDPAQVVADLLRQRPKRMT